MDARDPEQFFYWHLRNLAINGTWYIGGNWP